MTEPILNYEIIKNQLKGEAKFIGKIIHTLTYNNKALIEEIVKRNSTVTKQEAAAVISLYEDLIREQLRAGNTVSTGIFQASLSMRGAFESETDKIDYKKHKASIVIRPASGQNKSVCKGLRFHKYGKTRHRYYISNLFDSQTRRTDTLTCGGLFTINGKGLKVYSYENKYDLRLTASDGTQRSLHIPEASPSRLSAVVPADLPPGPATLTLRLSYASVTRDFQKVKVEIV